MKSANEPTIVRTDFKLAIRFRHSVSLCSTQTLLAWASRQVRFRFLESLAIREVPRVCHVGVEVESESFKPLPVFLNICVLGCKRATNSV